MSIATRYVNIFYGVMLNAAINSAALATYSVTTMDNNSIVVGADSRATNNDGSFDDNICKIFYIGDSFVFTLTGYRSYVDASGHEIDVLKFVLNSKYKSDVSIDNFMKNTVKSLVELLNSHDISATKNIQTNLIMVGFEKQGNPVVVSQRIGKNKGESLFINTDLAKISKQNVIVPFDRPEETNEVLSRFSIIESAKQLPITIIEKKIYVIDQLISRIITQNTSPSIGGLPSIFVIDAKGAHRWIRKARNCEN